MDDQELIVCISRTSEDCQRLLSDPNFQKLKDNVFKDRLKILNVESNLELLQHLKRSKFTHVPLLLGNMEEAFQKTPHIMNHLRNLGAQITREKLKKQTLDTHHKTIELHPVKQKLLSVKPNAIDMDLLSRYSVAMVFNKDQVDAAIFQELATVIEVVDLDDTAYDKVYTTFKEKGDVTYAVIATPSVFKNISAIYNYTVENVPIGNISCTQKIKEFLQKTKIQEL